MDWRGVLVDADAVPVARLLRGSTTVEAFEGSGVPMRIPGGSFLASYSSKGDQLPPVFDPQVDAEAVDATTLFGSVDAPRTVLRIARRSTTFQECAGGTHDGLPCSEESECPDGICGGSSCG